MTLGEKIKELRNLNKISQEYIAEQLGVSRQSVSKWETGTSMPSTDNMISLSDIFKVSVEELTHPDATAKLILDTKKETSEIRRPTKKQFIFFTAFTVLFLCALGLALYMRFHQYPEELILSAVLLSCLFMLCAFAPIMIAIWKFIWKVLHAAPGR